MQIAALIALKNDFILVEIVKEIRNLINWDEFKKLLSFNALKFI